MSKNNGIEEVIKVLKSKNRFVITSHVNPEGDSVGSQIAMALVLKSLGKKTVMADHDEVPENLRFLPMSGKILKEVSPGFDPDAYIVLDCPVLGRVGRIAGGVTEDVDIVNIDHHTSNDFFGTVNWVDPGASSVGEMVYRIVKKLNVPVGGDMAGAIYAAILTDTGMFNYNNTSCSTHNIAGELIETGLDPKKIHREIYERKSESEVRLLGMVLSGLKVEKSGKVAHISLTREMLKTEGVVKILTDEFINYPRSLSGVEVAIFFRENGGGSGDINVSFRSQGGVDVDKVAAKFGGGGHPRAAGCLIRNAGPLGEVKKKVIAEVNRFLRKK